MKGIVTNVQRFSIHDGPGIRTTVFLQGCPLRCRWCHNPEGIRTAPLLSFQPDKCVACGACASVCPHGAHLLDPMSGRHLLRRERCAVCGRCATVCYARALEIVGRELSVAEVMAEVEADRPFYACSGGGLTLSGGEPLAQIDFATAVLAAARQAEIHRVVETCGAVPRAHLRRVLPLIDLFLFDLKETDSARHRRCTGAGNRWILANLRWLRAAGAAVRLRLPLIPGYNDRPEHLAAVAALAGELAPLEGVEILPYHRLGTAKHPRFGWPVPPPIQPPNAEQVHAWAECLRALGVPVRAPDAAPAPLAPRSQP